VLHITEARRMAGTERSLLMLLDHSDRSMFEHAVVIRGSGGLADELARRNVTTFAIPRIGRAAPIALGRLAALLIKLRPHVVHIYGGRLDAVVASALRIPVVERKNVCRNNYYRPMLNFRFADRLLNRFVAASISPSEAVRSHYISRGYNPGAIRVIYNGVEEALPRSPAELARKRHELGAPADAFLVSFAGRLMAEKGVDVLLPALALLPENVFGVIMGDGPRRASHEKQAAQLDLSRRTTFTGFRSDVREVFACSDAVAIPSYTEPLANVALEAMAEGKPVVATNVEGMPEAVEHGITGLLIPPGDPAALAEGLAALAADAEAARQMGAEGRKRILRRHSPRVMARQTEELYLEVLRPAAREKELECHRITAESAFRKLSS
jgi:glycosyltransferase involved in cell wall biosynthesis